MVLGDYRDYQHLDYDWLVSTLREKTKGLYHIVWKQYGQLIWKAFGKWRTWDYWRLSSRNLESKKKIVAMTVAPHGEEQAGELAAAQHAVEWFELCEEDDIGGILYFCTDPCAFDYRRRRRIGDRRMNNDFVRYRISEKDWVDDLGASKEFLEWKWSADSFDIPAEPRLLAQDLRTLPLEKIRGAVDLHQDYFKLFHGKARSYAYVFGKGYNSIVRKVEKVVPIARNTLIGSGQSSASKTNEYGLIVDRSDGSVSDLFYRLNKELKDEQGRTYVACVETSRDTPVEDAIKVNDIWVKGIIGLVAKL